QVTAITVTNGGSNYQTSPMVTIVGGGGHGARAEAVILCSESEKPSTCQVENINVLDPGEDYVAPPTVTFDPPGATGQVIVANGRVVGVRVLNGGCYSSPPTVTITGGMRSAKSRPARAEAFISNGRVNFVRI